MAQIFDRSSNALARMSLILTGLIVIALGVTLDSLQRSPWVTRQGQRPDQPVPFSHRHHAEQLGIDCRYCHSSVEKSSFAGVPDTETCMTCHSQLFTSAPLLAPVRRSLAMDAPLRWNRVNKVPDFVFFNHSIHVDNGIGCASCHGPVNEMTMTWKSKTLYMKWCLDCHRQPEKFIRPRGEAFDMHWRTPANQTDEGRKLVAAYHVNTTLLTDCGTCHR